MSEKERLGGTARNVGNWYLKSISLNPSISIEAFSEIYWGMRMQLGYRPDQVARVQELVSEKSYESLIEIIVDVLSVEIGSDFDDLYFDTFSKQRAIYDRVFRDELNKFGIPAHIIG